MHHLKALGLPPTAWVHATNRDLGLWKEKIQGLVTGFISQSNPKIGGFRVEVRVQLQENLQWERLLELVEEQVNAFLDHAQGLEVKIEALLEHIQDGLSASEARLCRTEKVKSDQWSKLFCFKE